MEIYELAEKIALLLHERGHMYDEDIMDELAIDDFELIKAKNVLCRYHGIAIEKWHKDGEESRQAIFLTSEYSGDNACELIRRVFHDPDFKTRRRMKEESRKSEIRSEVRDLLDRLQEEWGGPLNGR